MRVFIFAIILLSASRIASAPSGQGVVIWNVGQGQWVTVIEGGTCYHFDMGGEFFPWVRLKGVCGFRENKILLSHWDWDHIGALAQSKLKRSLPDLCLLKPPLGPSKKRKELMVKRIPRCKEGLQNLSAWQPQNALNSNDSSQVFKYRDVLLPGDSSKIQERVWSQAPWVKSSRYLVLGHHGSNTSTSAELLKQLPYLRMSFSSARWRRYSHPHPATVARLKMSHTPLLRTEDWGNIWIE